MVNSTFIPLDRCFTEETSSKFVPFESLYNQGGLVLQFKAFIINTTFLEQIVYKKALKKWRLRRWSRGQIVKVQIRVKLKKYSIVC